MTRDVANVVALSWKRHGSTKGEFTYGTKVLSHKKNITVEISIYHVSMRLRIFRPYE